MYVYSGGRPRRGGRGRAIWECWLEGIGADEKEIGMSEKRNITREDIHLEARLLSEGARIEVKAPLETPLGFPGTIILDGCEITTLLRPNPNSRLEAVLEGDRVSISDMGEVLGTAVFEERPDWFDITLSNGQPASTVVLGMTPDLMAMIQNNRCYNQASGKGCRYCGLFVPGEWNAEAGDWALDPSDLLRKRGEISAEAIALAVDHGWRGMIALSGGALPPKRRGQLTERLEILMEPLREAVDADVLASLQISANTYPPEDLEDLHKWRDMGINMTQFDLEVMEPAYFPAVCPGKNAAHPYEYWREAQEASVEVFGRWHGTATSVVMGIEPMNSLVEGVEERLEAGVLTTPLCFQATPGSAYEQFRAPTADWLVEANEKMAECHFRLEDKLDAPLLADDRPGYTRTGRSYHILMMTDEIWRRGQEMGKLPPGLPKQGT